MSAFRRQALIISITILGVAICGLVIYVYRVFTNIPAFPQPKAIVETWGLPGRFHMVLSKPEKQHVLDGQFRVVTSSQFIPTSLKHAFAVITGEQQFALANPGQHYQATDVVDEPGLPFRRLVFGGVSGNKWFIHYEHGGIGHSYEVVIFVVQSKDRVQFLWGGIGSHRAKDLQDLRRSIAESQFCETGYY